MAKPAAKAPTKAPAPKAAPAPEPEVEEEETVQFEEGDGVVVDMSEVNEEGNFEAIPRGIYEAEIDTLEYGRSKSSNNPMWTIRWNIVNGEFANRKLFYHAVFSEGGMPRVKKMLARIASDGDYAKELLSSKWSPEAVASEGRLIGARARIRVDVKPYEGKPSNNVRDVLEPGEGAYENG